MPGFNLGAPFEGSEKGNWNIAAEYAIGKILRPLTLLDQYQTIAEFGTSEMMEEFVTDPEIKTIARLKALKRFASTLILLIDNTSFALKFKTHKQIFVEQRAKIVALQKLFPYIESKTRNEKIGRTNIKINEDAFNNVFNMLIQIKAEINDPLNKSDLIFVNIEEFDPQAAKKKILDRLKTRG